MQRKQDFRQRNKDFKNIYQKYLEYDAFEIKEASRKRNYIINKNLMQQNKNQIFNVDIIDDPANLIQRCKLISYYLVNFDSLKTHQIRKILELMNEINLKMTKWSSGFDEVEFLNRLQKIQIQIIYSTSKHQSQLNNFGEFFYKLLRRIEQKQNNNERLNEFRKVYEILQSIIAFHKFFGGKD
ncbi:MAG: type III-A CRISPR-associated protein Csm2 [Candidatus Helarchaeota archaeon]